MDLNLQIKTDKQNAKKVTVMHTTELSVVFLLCVQENKSFENSLDLNNTSSHFWTSDCRA